MESNTMNYKAVLDKYNDGGDSLIKILVQNRNSEFENVNLSYKVSALLTYAVYEDIKNVSVKDFGEYVLSISDYLGTIVVSEDMVQQSCGMVFCAPLVYMNNICMVYGSSIAEKVNSGFQDMFFHIPDICYSYFCSCVAILAEYTNLVSCGAELEFKIDVPDVIKHLIEVGDTKYTEEKGVSGEHVWSVARAGLMSLLNK